MNPNRNISSIVTLYMMPCIITLRDLFMLLLLPSKVLNLAMKLYRWALASIFRIALYTTYMDIETNAIHIKLTNKRGNASNSLFILPRMHSTSDSRSLQPCGYGSAILRQKMTFEKKMTVNYISLNLGKKN